MTEADEPNTPFQDARNLLLEALDEHGWRVESLAACLDHLATADGPIETRDLAGLADALRGHVEGILEAAREAHRLLGSPA